MNDTSIEQKYIHEANICKLLSLLYCQPNEDIIETVEYLEQESINFWPEKTHFVSEMKANIAQSPLEEMKVAHAKLFIGPFDLIAPPYSSVYLDGQRRVMGDSTMEALNYYRRAGVNPDSNFKEPPDHITTELEFIYYLNTKFLNSEDKQWLDLRQDFIENHLDRWINPFAKKVKESKITFYQNLALLTEDLLEAM